MRLTVSLKNLPDKRWLWVIKEEVKDVRDNQVQTNENEIKGCICRYSNSSVDEVRYRLTTKCYFQTTCLITDMWSTSIRKRQAASMNSTNVFSSRSPYLVLIPNRLRELRFSFTIDYDRYVWNESIIWKLSAEGTI